MTPWPYLFLPTVPPDNMRYGFGFVVKLVIEVKELAQDVDGVRHGYRHQEYGDHGTHDMYLEPQPDEEPHGADHADNGHDHRRDNK